jgi:hypothetical protein
LALQEDVEADLKWAAEQKEHVRVGKLGWERFTDKDGRIFYRTSLAVLRASLLHFSLPACLPAYLRILSSVCIYATRMPF